MATERANEPWERRVRETAHHAEAEVQRLIGFLNDEVVPEVRRNGSAALKTVATELHRLAERMDRSVGQPTEPPVGPATPKAP